MSDSSAVSALPRLLTARELSDAIGLAPWRIYELCRSDDIPHVRVGRAVRFSAVAVGAWLEAGGTRPSGDGPHAA